MDNRAAKYTLICGRKYRLSERARLQVLKNGYWEEVCSHGISREYLTGADWAGPHRLSNGSTHILASIVQRSAREMRFSPAGSDEFPPEIESVEKAIAQLKAQNKVYGKVLKRFWLNHAPLYVIARDLRYSDEKAKEVLGRAEFQAGRYILEWDQVLTRALTA